MTATASIDPSKGKVINQETEVSTAQTLKADISKALEPSKGLKLYKSADKSFNMYTPSGKRIIFARGMFCTDDVDMIAYLDNEIRQRSSNIYVDPNEPTFDPEKYDPKAAMRREILIELANAGMLRAAGDPNRDMGTSVQPQLTPTSSRDIAAVALGGSNTPVIKVGSKA